MSYDSCSRCIWLRWTRQNCYVPAVNSSTFLLSTGLIGCIAVQVERPRPDRRAGRWSQAVMSRPQYQSHPPLRDEQPAP
jgi:hypothetical protein